MLFISLRELVSSKECAVTSATERDFADASAIGDGIFEPQYWKMQTAKLPTHISVGWFDDSIDAVAQSQYFIYNCGYSEQDMNAIYTPENFDALFAAFESWSQTSICEKEGITLREFTLNYEGRPYTVRYWVNRLSDKRVQDIQLGFLQGDENVLEFYAAKLFPDFITCASLG